MEGGLVDFRAMRRLAGIAWTVAIVCAVVLWFAVMVDRLGWLYVCGFIALALALRYYSPSDK